MTSGRPHVGSTFREHWPEYAIEAAGLGVFMVSAGTFATLLEHPASPVHRAIGDPLVRRFLMGLAMGLTAVAVVYSPWGQRSGAHLNPAVTLTFWRLNKIATPDALWYAIFQFAGGAAGLGLVALALGGAIAHPAVNYVITAPGSQGAWVAFAAEVLIAFVLMLAVLEMTNRPHVNRLTGVMVGALLVVYITVEAPYSGMSLNPARTVASDVSARMWPAIWVYFTATPLGMLLAAEVHRAMHGAHAVLCAKLHHENHERCIFRCAYPRSRGS